MPQSEFQVRGTGYLSIAQLAAATNATFADYFLPIAHTTDGFAAFCRANSMDLARSVLLEHRADGRLAGLTMLAIRGVRGWCGGFGLTPEFRGRGLSAALADALISQSRRQGLATLHLEVLAQNTRAIQTYARAGFRTDRDLMTLTGPLGDAPDPGVSGLEIEAAETPLAAWSAGLGLPAPAPCWQREPVSLLTVSGVLGLTALRAGRIAGMLLFRPNPAGGLLWVGHLAFTEEDTGRALLARAAADTGLKNLLIHNEPEDSPLCALGRALSLSEVHRQHEMSLTLE